MHFDCFEAVLSNCQENYMDVLIKSLLSVFLNQGVELWVFGVANHPGNAAESGLEQRILLFPAHVLINLAFLPV